MKKILCIIAGFVSGIIFFVLIVVIATLFDQWLQEKRCPLQQTVRVGINDTFLVDGKEYRITGLVDVPVDMVKIRRR